jgi:dipeptidyl aminopeptidase/acylaminoacyl peptidase
MTCRNGGTSARLSVLPFQVCALLAAAASITRAQERSPSASAKHPLTIRETLALRRPSSVELAPDGRHVAYVVTEALLEQNRDRALLYVAAVSRPNAPQPIAEAIHVTAVRWSPDGTRLTYVAETARGTQIWEVTIDGQGRLALTPATRRLHLFWESPDSYMPYDVSKDGATLVYAVDDTAAGRAELDTKLRGGVVYEGGTARSRRELVWWRLPFEIRALDRSTGRERRLWAGRAGLGDFRPEFALSPDGRRLAVLRATSERFDSNSVRLSSVDLTTGKETTIVDDLSQAWQPTWMDSGDTVTFVSTGPRREVLASREGVYAVALDDRVLRLVTNDSAAVAHAFGSRSSMGRLLEEEVERQGGQFLSGCTLDAKGTRAACIEEAPMIPPEAVTLDVRAGHPAGPVQLLTHLNRTYDHVALGQVREITWRNRTIAGSAGLILPVDYHAGRRYPLLVMLYNLWGRRFFISDAPGFTSYPAQAFAGHGYAVVLMNTPGNAFSYTPGDFCAAKALEADGMAEAVRAVIDSLVAQGLVDSTRMGIMGWSYGGFWTPYIIGEHPRWFQAAAEGEGAAHYPIVNWFGYDSVVRVQEKAYFGGPPYGAYYARWKAVSPVLNADRIRIPLRMEYSEAYQAGLELFTAIVDQGGQADLVEYPDDQHVFLRPLNRYNSMMRHYDWFNFWLLDEAERDPAKTQQYVRWNAMKRALATRTAGGAAATPAQPEDNAPECRL